MLENDERQLPLTVHGVQLIKTSVVNRLCTCHMGPNSVD